MNAHDFLSELRRLGYDASSAGAVSQEGKMLFRVNGHLMTFDEARPLTNGETFEDVVQRAHDSTHPPR
jgi:hypothetical protein